MAGSSFLGTGWSFPPVFDSASHQLRLSAGVDNINQSIDLLLRTPVGSRPLLPGYGCDLARFVFRRIDATAQEEIVQSVRLTLLNGEPRIAVEQVSVAVQKGGATVTVDIGYRVRSTNTRHNHVFPFSQLEGTNLEALD
ncbi:GPW/gp25 family protein [Pseudomonas fakonensis]|uniref:GPW/gp25 family protein n=1 Tax=Pseudomonas fakonensis TaxID=2842355 RepID=A0ABX8N2C1_9PSED|nr:GPW/gp25 family protein [Pseudomonas fakonensis]QXH50495.1 GPW/gp25 family protein [Pseudomonas fakonensis]